MKEQSTTKGFAVLSAAGMIVKVLSLVYIPFLLRIIGKGGYGIYSAAYQIFVFIYVLTNSGIPVAISKVVSELIAVKNYRDAVKSFKIARLTMLCLGIGMSIALAIFAYPLAKITKNEMSYLSILALSPTILFSSIVSSYRGYFQGRGNMTPTAVSQIIEQIMNTVFTLVFAAIFMKYGVEAGCAGGTIGTSLGSLIASIYLIAVYEQNKKIKVPKGTIENTKFRHTNKQLLRKIIAYGLPITLCVGLQNAGNIVDLANVKSRLLVAGFTQMQGNELFGTFTKYRTLLSVPITIISALSAAVLPAISGAFALKDKRLLQNKIEYAFRFCLLVAIPSAVGLAVLRKPVFITLFGSGYADGANFLIYGWIVLILTAIVQIQITILQGIGKLYASTLYMILGIIGKIVTNYFLISIPSINIYGAVFGNIVCFAIPLFLNTRLIKKSMKVNYSIIRHAKKPIFASAVMTGSVLATFYGFNFILVHIHKGYFANAGATIISIIIGSIVYFYSLVLTGGIRKEDIDSLPARFKKFIPKKALNKIKA